MTPRVLSLRWDSEARGLLVDRSLFERELLRPGGAQGPAPNAFRATQFSSFVRQLYRYGFLRKGNINVAPESPGEDPMNRAAAEEVSSGTESCGNSSPEPEEPGLHRVQVVSSCDPSNGESMDPTSTALMGRDFISFQLGSGSFAVSDGATWITQRCWESKGIMVEQMKLYLGHTSVEGPQNTSDMDGRLWSTKLLTQLLLPPLEGFGEPPLGPPGIPIPGHWDHPPRISFPSSGTPLHPLILHRHPLHPLSWVSSSPSPWIPCSRALPELLGHNPNVPLSGTSPCWQLQGSSLYDITVLAAPTFHALETLHGKRPEPHPVSKLTATEHPGLG
ncbi:hypothetical protein DUI87_20793 [Hirundo rustica rustica]|uniref:HSF-type DNA-binding domain-containing protein n=1 Tax=Hirundo rustica rustica TaxID=333673 RepID=A0A3M0JNM6_HIRRU|nr:hypothetical protein DUI87_20793 [Hirundo rustica rustica]